MSPLQLRKGLWELFSHSQEEQTKARKRKNNQHDAAEIPMASQILSNNFYKLTLGERQSNRYWQPLDKEITHEKSSAWKQDD